MNNPIKKYQYHIFQPHYCVVHDCYEVEALSKEDADKIIVEAYQTGDLYGNANHLHRDEDFTWESLEPVNEDATIEDQHGDEVSL